MDNGNFESHFAIESEFRFLNYKQFFRFFADQRPIQNIIGDFRDVARDFFRGKFFFDIRIVRLLFVIPVPSARQNLPARQWKMFICRRFVVTERRVCRVEKFAVFVIVMLGRF